MHSLSTVAWQGEAPQPTHTHTHRSPACVCVCVCVYALRACPRPTHTYTQTLRRYKTVHSSTHSGHIQSIGQQVSGHLAGCVAVCLKCLHPFEQEERTKNARERCRRDERGREKTIARSLATRRNMRCACGTNRGAQTPCPVSVCLSVCPRVLWCRQRDALVAHCDIPAFPSTGGSPCGDNVTSPASSKVRANEAREGRPTTVTQSSN